MATKPLRAVKQTEVRAVIRPDFEGLVFRGSNTDDHTCPTCGNLLAAGVRKGQIFELIIKCHKCNALSAFPSLPAGAALTGPWVAFPTGIYRITQTIDIDDKSLIGADRDGHIPKSDSIHNFPAGSNGS